MVEETLGVRGLSPAAGTKDKLSSTGTVTVGAGSRGWPLVTPGRAEKQGEGRSTPT